MLLSSSAHLLSCLVHKLFKVAYCRLSLEFTGRYVLHHLNKLRHLKRAGNPLGRKGTFRTILVTANCCVISALKFRMWSVKSTDINATSTDEETLAIFEKMSNNSSRDRLGASWVLFVSSHTHSRRPTCSVVVCSGNESLRSMQWHAYLDILPSISRWFYPRILLVNKSTKFASSS